MAFAKIKFVLVASSDNNATSIKSSLDTYLTGKQIAYLDTPLRVQSYHDGQWCTVACIRFRNKSDALAWYDDILAKWTSGAIASLILSSSFVKYHVCYQTEKPSIECTSLEAEYKREVKNG